MSLKVENSVAKYNFETSPENGTDCTTELPNEVIQRIFTGCSYVDACRATSVCKRWVCLANNDLVWESILKSSFPTLFSNKLLQFQEKDYKSKFQNLFDQINLGTYEAEIVKKWSPALKTRLLCHIPFVQWNKNFDLRTFFADTVDIKAGLQQVDWVQSNLTHPVRTCLVKKDALSTPYILMPSKIENSSVQCQYALLILRFANCTIENFFSDRNEEFDEFLDMTLTDLSNTESFKNLLKYPRIKEVLEKIPDYLQMTLQEVDKQITGGLKKVICYIQGNISLVVKSNNKLSLFSYKKSIRKNLYSTCIETTLQTVDNLNLEVEFDALTAEEKRSFDLVGELKH